MGKHLCLPPNFPKTSPEYLSLTIGAPIDFLPSMDMLKDLYFQINIRDRKITLSEKSLPGGKIKLDFDALNGIPYANIMMNGSLHKVNIDTGAKVPFLRKQALAVLEPASSSV